MLDHAPSEQHRVQLRFRWPPLGNHPATAGLHFTSNVCILNQHTAADRAQISRRPRFRCRRQQANQAQVFFLLQDGARLDLKIRRDDHFAENFADHFRQRLGQRTIANDNSSKGRLFISRESLVPGLSRIRIRPDATGIGMFKNCDGRLFEFGDQLRRRADVENVVKGEFLPVKLFKILVEIAVERGGLMRIFSVAQSHCQRKGK